MRKFSIKSKQVLMPFCATVAVLVASSCILTAAGASPGEANYKSGLTAYARKDFKAAAAAFSKAVEQGNKSPMTYLYLGHACWGAGDRAGCLQAYSTITERFPTCREAQLALQQLQRLDPATAAKYAGKVAPPILPTATAGANASAGTSTHRLEDLIIIPPQFGHAPVRQHTIDIVKSAVRHLKPGIYKLLNDSGATITVDPNAMDRWPNNKDLEEPMPNSDDTYGEAGGQTYHRDNGGPDIGIHERAMVRGTKRLNEPFPDDFLTHISFHEMGHGVDDVTKMSLDQGFLAVYNSEIAQFNTEDHTQYRYYLKPMECCAEITGGLIGDDHYPETEQVTRKFPRTAAWIKTRLAAHLH